MNENFIALDKEKRNRIINAAMYEFSAKGFKNASTNEIVKRAGISKGALFHYFSSKQELYEFLYRYGIDYFLEATESRIKDMPTDIFKRWLEFASLKMEIVADYPDMADFMQSATYSNDSSENYSLLKNEYEQFSATIRCKIFEGIDLSKFKPDIDISKVMKIIWWVLEGFAVSKQKESFGLLSFKDDNYIQSLTDEAASYLDILKVSFYKPEYLL